MGNWGRNGGVGQYVGYVGELQHYSIVYLFHARNLVNMRLRSTVYYLFDSLNLKDMWTDKFYS